MCLTERKQAKKRCLKYALSCISFILDGPFTRDNVRIIFIFSIPTRLAPAAAVVFLLLYGGPNCLFTVVPIHDRGNSVLRRVFLEKNLLRSLLGHFHQLKTLMFYASIR